MIKKIFVALVITAILGAGVFGLVKSTFAQDGETTEVEETLAPETQVETEETPCDGLCDGDGDQRQTQLQQRLNLNKGICDGICDGDQLQTRTRQMLQVNEGTCNGECVGDREQLHNQTCQMMRLNEGTRDGTCDESCDGNGAPQIQNQTGTQFGGGNGQRGNRGK